MNKIYKVIWNEARNAYVVVSEIAKNHGSKSCSTKKLLAMLIATGVMTCASFDVLAEKPVAATTAAQQYVALKAADFPATGPLRFYENTWGGLGKYSDAKAEWDAQQDGTKQIGKYTYTYDRTNKYWVREGYVLTVDQKGGKYTPLSANQIRADVAYKDGVAEGILQSVTSTVSANGTVTNMGESLNKVTAGSFAGVSHSGGTEVAGSWNYIIQDSSWEDSVEAENHKDGYVDLIGNKMPKGFITAESNKGLVWDNNKQAYTYKGKAVDYSNVYVIEGKIGVFTNKEGTKVYTGTVYGKNNEILMTVKDKDNNFYSYWAAEVTDPSATMATYRVEEYKKNLAVLEENDNKLSRDDIKKVTLDTSKANSAIIGLLRNGDKAVDGAITVTSGGGTGGSGAAHDTFVKISNAADMEGKTFATGSKVEAIVDNGGATTGIKINGQDYTIKSGSKVSVTKNAAEKTTTITVDGQATTITDTDTHNALESAILSGKTLTITGKDNDSVNVDLSSIDTDTKYTAGNGITISGENNAIAVKLKEGENNLEVTEAGLELKKELTVNRVAAGDFYMSTAGIGYGDKAYITSSGLNANSQKITGVAAGAITETSTDAVNGSQLHATNKKVDELNAKAGKHTTLVAGDNVTLVEKKTDNGLEYTVTAKDTTYSAGDNVAIDKDNKISVDLSKYAKTEDVAVVYNNNKTSLRSTNASVAENAIALGKGASAVKNSIAIGNGAYTQDGTLTKGQSVALGNGAVTGAKSTSIGSNAIGGREGTITIGANANNGSLYATIIGTDSVINSDETAYKVKIDTLFVPIEKDVNIQGATATLVGTSNKVDNKNNLVYSGVANNVMGAANTIEASNGVTIQGTGNKVTDAYKDMNITPDEGLAILGGDYSVLAKKQSGAIAVVGGANTVSKQTDSTVIGYDNQLAGDEKKGSHDVFMAGSHNRLNNVSDSIVMGNKNTINGVSNVISFGHQNTISADNAVAIGNGAGVSVEGGVALGVGSVASTAANALGYGAAEGETSIAWNATHGAVSVGSSVEGKEITRQITNVAAGTADTDAVNVSQLKKVSDTANAGWNLSTNGVATEATNVKPGEYVDFSGDKNISVSHDGTNVKVELNKNIDVNSVQTNALNSKYNLSVGTMAENGIMPFLVNSTGAFYAANNNFSVDKDGKVIATAGEIGNVVLKNGVYTGNSALRDGELYVGDADGNYSQITTKGAKLGKVTVAEDGKISGVAAGEISSTSTDAINGSQLHQTNENVAALDKRVTQNEADIAQNKADIAQNKADIAQNKADIAQNKADIAQNKADIAANRTDIDKNAADIAQNKTDIKNLGNRVTNVEELAKKHTTVTQGDNIAVTESTNKDGGKEYKVALNKDINLDSVTTGQTVMNNDGLKVGKDVSVTATAVIAGKTSISDEGVKVGDKTYISDKGLNANDQKVTNVAAGELSATSKDAVNGSQLYETNQAIANNATNISSLSHSISNLDNRVNKVGAGAAALAALHPLDFDPDAKWDFAAGYGNYRGANAAAVGAYYRPNEDTMFSVGGTFGNGENMVNAGISFKLGSGSSHVSTSRVAMAKEIKELRGELEAMKSAMLDANAGKKIDTSKLQLFPDVPQNHWAYEYVAQLAGNGMIEGYPDGNFAGDRPMTRYEFAAILYRAMTKGAVLSDKILSEFSHELEYFTVDTIAKDKAGNPTIQRVRTVKENKNK